MSNKIVDGEKNKMKNLVRIVEVGLRDGLQSLPKFLPTSVKTRLLKLLVESGLKELEVTSFVSPRWVPQFKDAFKVTQESIKYHQVISKALIPNMKGFNRALEAGISNLVFVFSTSEKHNFKNLNMSVHDSLKELDAILKHVSTKHRVTLQVNLATTFGYIDEKVILTRVLELTDIILSMGISKIVYCDTSGMAVPTQVEELIQEVISRYKIIPGLHFHDTFGCAMANTIKSIENGVRIFETSLGGLGGCPFLPGATGNIATEDVVRALQKMNIDTGINLEQLLKAVYYLNSELKNNDFFTSKLFKATRILPSGSNACLF